MDTPVAPVETFTLKVQGRDYTVEKLDPLRDEEAPFRYVLRGKRGAHYTTMRNANNRHMMFLVHAGKGFGIPAAMDGVWLSDKDGTLKEVR